MSAAITCMEQLTSVEVYGTIPLLQNERTKCNFSQVKLFFKQYQFLSLGNHMQCTEVFSAAIAYIYPISTKELVFAKE